MRQYRKMVPHIYYSGVFWNFFSAWRRDFFQNEPAAVFREEMSLGSKREKRRARESTAKLATRRHVSCQTRRFSSGSTGHERSSLSRAPPWQQEGCGAAVSATCGSGGGGIRGRCDQVVRVHILAALPRLFKYLLNHRCHG